MQLIERRILSCLGLWSSSGRQVWEMKKFALKFAPDAESLLTITRISAVFESLKTHSSELVLLC